ncbi:MAG: S-4TM family putative pore-forming effector [Acidovorax sp.]|uniref:S-4TM family putative pore-forming effector n=1 Tax=Acidovorax sp. TaxID=1872122 RepID=UPI00391D5052
MNNKHQINIEQNKSERLILLRAQRLFYARAKQYQAGFTLLALILPLLGVLFGTSQPEIRPYLALGSIVVLLLDVWVFSPFQKEDCKRGARVQEQFDTEVLKLDWNPLVAGRRIDAEDIRAITATPVADTEQKRLMDWYEPVISRLPLELGRFICQRTNLAYDMRVRKEYAGMLLGAAILLSIALALAGVYQGQKFSDLILTMCVPLLPLFAYVLREYRKQNDTIEALTTLKSEVEKLWDKALSGASSEELTSSSRALQDAIYRHRASNPLVFDWLYNKLRNREEDLTRHAVEKLVTDAEQKMNHTGTR